MGVKVCTPFALNIYRSQVLEKCRRENEGSNICVGSSSIFIATTHPARIHRSHQPFTTAFSFPRCSSATGVEMKIRTGWNDWTFHLYRNCIIKLINWIFLNGSKISDLKWLDFWQRKRLHALMNLHNPIGIESILYINCFLLTTIRPPGMPRSTTRSAKPRML